MLHKNNLHPPSSSIHTTFEPQHQSVANLRINIFENLADSFGTITLDELDKMLDVVPSSKLQHHLVYSGRGDLAGVYW